MLCSQVRPKMALKGDKSSTTDNCMLRVTDPIWIGSMMSSRDVVEAPLNPDNILHRFSKLEGMNPICLIIDTCKRSAKLPRSTRILLISKSSIPKVRMRTSRLGCNTRTGSIGGKTMVPSIG